MKIIRVQEMFQYNIKWGVETIRGLKSFKDKEKGHSYSALES